MIKAANALIKAYKTYIKYIKVRRKQYQQTSGGRSSCGNVLAGDQKGKYNVSAHGDWPSRTGYLPRGRWRPSVQPFVRVTTVSSTLWHVRAKAPGNMMEEKLLDVEAREWRANSNNKGFPGEDMK